MKFKKLILGYIIGFNIFGLIGCSTTRNMTKGEYGSMLSDIGDAAVEEYKKSDEYKYRDPSLLYLVECPKCGSELTCTNEWCMENEEDREAYEQHQANYKRKIEQNEESYIEEEEPYIEYTADEVVCFFCGCVEDVEVANSIGSYGDIDHDNYEDYFHEKCFDKWFKEQSNNKN